jgi:hypothetical protein
MSFYVYLPSNVKHINDKYLNSEDGEMSQNVTSNYTTHLVERKKFDVPHEVAVVDVTFMHSWKIPVGQLFVIFRSDNRKRILKESKTDDVPDFLRDMWKTKSDLLLTDKEREEKRLNEFELPDDELFKVFNLYIYDGEDLDSFLDRLQYDIQIYYMKLIYNYRLELYKKFVEKYPNRTANREFFPYTNFTKSTFFSHDPVVEQIKNELTFKSLPTFSTGGRGWNVYTNLGLKIRFNGPICRLLKLPSYIELEKTHVDQKATYESLLGIPRTLKMTQLIFIYTDIIKDQFVGNTLSPLIRTVHVDNDYQKGGFISFDNPNYFPVSKTHLDSINIQIKDETGLPINFVDALFSVTLHFRPIV